MNYNDYQRSCRATAIYPAYAATVYPVLGLLDEIGELQEKLFHAAPREEVLKECGDVLWYCAIVADDCGIQFARVVAEMGSVAYTPAYMHLPASRIAGIVKKVIRDDNGFMNTDTRGAVSINLSEVVACVQYWATEHASTLDEVCALNLAKLKSRADRGVISGSGDNR